MKPSRILFVTDVIKGMSPTYTITHSVEDQESCQLLFIQGFVVSVLAILVLLEFIGFRNVSPLYI